MPGHTESSLDVVLVGDSHELEMLRFKLYDARAVSRVEQVPHTHHAWGELREHAVNAVIFDFAAPYDDMDSLALTVFQMREEFPEIVFGFLVDEAEYTEKTAALSSEVKARLSHYYRISRAVTPIEIERLIDRFVKWHRDVADQRSKTPRYRYDVALSFAGEDRKLADQLATLLKDRGVRVFYDSWEQAELWGKNLFDHLFAIYSEQARYCIILVSKAYSDKMWTVHERRAAQQRVLENRDVEYLLPVRIDDTRLPGLPNTVAYLDVEIGMPQIAGLFVKKLGAAMGRGRRAETGS